MKPLRELLSKKFMKFEILRSFSNFGACDFCNDLNHTCGYREYNSDGLYKEGLMCIECYDKIHDKNYYNYLGSWPDELVYKS